MIKTVVVSPLFRPGLVYAQTMRLEPGTYKIVTGAQELRGYRTDVEFIYVAAHGVQCFDQVMSLQRILDLYESLGATVRYVW